MKAFDYDKFEELTERNLEWIDHILSKHYSTYDFCKKEEEAYGREIGVENYQVDILPLKVEAFKILFTVATKISEADCWIEETETMEEQ